jgi:hypothetical protein
MPLELENRLISYMNTSNDKMDLFSILSIPYNHGLNSRKIYNWFKQNSTRRYKFIFDKECSDNFFDLKKVHEYYPSIRTIVIVVNPWDRVFQSFLHNLKTTKMKINFEKFVSDIENIDPSILKNQLDYVQYVNNDHIVSADCIIRYEMFEEDFKQVQHCLNTSDSLTIERPSTIYKNMYSETSKNKVAELFARDIEHFGYKF